MRSDERHETPTEDPARVEAGLTDLESGEDPEPAGTSIPAESAEALAEEAGTSVEELPVPPWTATPEHGDPAHHAAPVEASRPSPASRAVAFLRRPVRPRTWAIAGVAGTLGFALFGAGVVIGARDPLLAPVRIAPAPLTSGPTAAERVFATASDSVVTVQVPGGGTGSGFFYRPDRIVTNDHVVASSMNLVGDLALGKRPKVTIVLADGRVRDARVLAVDPRLDLAILAAPTGLGVRPLAFGDAADLTPGEPAFVVGSPFGLATSVSSGIISGVDRASQFAADPVQNRLIQTDAAVNPGNSGGPLLDSTAGVVGIVTLRPDEADGRTTQGLAFALPSDVVVAAINQLERYGVVSHPQIGVTLKSPDPDRPGQRGPVVGQVMAGSAAAAAGLREDDQLLVVDGRETHDAAAVVDALLGRRAGDVVEVTVLRAGSVFTVDLTLRERPEAS